MGIFHTSISFPSEMKNLSLVEHAIDKLLADGYITDMVYGNVIVAATEGVLNAINHGNQHDPAKTCSVDIEIAEKPHALTITVHDEGPGFDFDALPDPTDPANLEKVNGRGIFIIRNLCDLLEFDRNGATMKMSFNLEVKELVEA